MDNNKKEESISLPKSLNELKNPFKWFHMISLDKLSPSEKKLYQIYTEEQQNFEVYKKLTESHEKEWKTVDEECKNKRLKLLENYKLEDKKIYKEREKKRKELESEIEICKELIEKKKIKLTEYETSILENYTSSGTKSIFVQEICKAIENISREFKISPPPSSSPLALSKTIDRSSEEEEREKKREIEKIKRKEQENKIESGLALDHQIRKLGLNVSDSNVELISTGTLDLEKPSTEPSVDEKISKACVAQGKMIEDIKKKTESQKKTIYVENPPPPSSFKEVKSLKPAYEPVYFPLGQEKKTVTWNKSEKSFDVSVGPIYDKKEVEKPPSPKEEKIGDLIKNEIDMIIKSQESKMKNSKIVEKIDKSSPLGSSSSSSDSSSSEESSEDSSSSDVFGDNEKTIVNDMIQEKKDNEKEEELPQEEVETKEKPKKGRKRKLVKETEEIPKDLNLEKETEKNKKTRGEGIKKGDSETEVIYNVKIEESYIKLNDMIFCNNGKLCETFEILELFECDKVVLDSYFKYQKYKESLSQCLNIKARVDKEKEKELNGTRTVSKTKKKKNPKEVLKCDPDNEKCMEKIMKNYDMSKPITIESENGEFLVLEDMIKQLQDNPVFNPFIRKRESTTRGGKSHFNTYASINDFNYTSIDEIPNIGGWKTLSITYNGEILKDRCYTCYKPIKELSESIKYFKDDKFKIYTPKEICTCKCISGHSREECKCLLGFHTCLSSLKRYAILITPSKDKDVKDQWTQLQYLHRQKIKRLNMVASKEKNEIGYQNRLNYIGAYYEWRMYIEEMRSQTEKNKIKKTKRKETGTKTRCKICNTLPGDKQSFSYFICSYCYRTGSAKKARQIIGELS